MKLITDSPQLMTGSKLQQTPKNYLQLSPEVKTTAALPQSFALMTKCLPSA